MLLRRKLSYVAANYLRISRDDGDKAESDSIQNQRELIKDYLKNHPEITKTREYVDDGFSGTNFERPAFIRMMSDIENGRIDCVIVKDLSRFGRNYIETGKYLERIFPMMEVRFISINDNYDSTNENGEADQIIIPFKNLINDAYCRDISIKIRSQLDVKRKNGKFIGSFAGYGYRKDPADKNHLIIDEYPANIVRLIFKLKLEGYSADRIAEHLNELNVLTPMEYKRSCGMNFNSGFRLSKNPVWNAGTVTRILTNEFYIGMSVQGKNRKINYKVKESRPVEEENWIRVADTHEPIVTESVFRSVQELLKLDTRTSPNAEKVDVFSGLVRCGDCGQNMIKRSTTKKGKRYDYFHCTTYKNKLGCSAHLISADKLYDAVLWQTKAQIAKVVEAAEMLREIERVPREQFKMKALNDQLIALQKEIERYSDLKMKVYQDMVDHVVSREEYAELSARFSQKIEKAREAQAEVESKKKKLDIGRILKQPWVEDYKTYQNIISLDRRVAVSVIEKIVVYDKSRIEICFRYTDEIELLLECAGMFARRLRVV